jgi:hypothetical protein
MNSTTLLPFQPDAMSPAQLAAVSYLARYAGHTHVLYAYQPVGRVHAASPAQSRTSTPRATRTATPARWTQTVVGSHPRPRRRPDARAAGNQAERPRSSACEPHGLRTSQTRLDQIAVNSRSLLRILAYGLMGVNARQSPITSSEENSLINSDLHIHIPPGFSGTMTIGKDGQVTVTSAATAAAPTASAAASTWSTLDSEMAEKLEELLRRQKGYDSITRSRDIAKVLIERGWEVYSVNLKGAYALFTYAGQQHGVSLYLSSIDLNNTKKAHRDFMMTLPGHDAHGSDVRIPINGKAYDQALANIEAVEKWADG